VGVAKPSITSASLSRRGQAYRGSPYTAAIATPTTPVSSTDAVPTCSTMPGPRLGHCRRLDEHTGAQAAARARRAGGEAAVSEVDRCVWLVRNSPGARLPQLDPTAADDRLCRVGLRGGVSVVMLGRHDRFGSGRSRCRLRFVRRFSDGTPTGATRVLRSEQGKPAAST
jgi:hypothetical protein